MDLYKDDIHQTRVYLGLFYHIAYLTLAIRDI